MPLTKIQSLGITDGTIVNADINASAAIAGTKLTGVGKVLQVVSTTKTDTATTSSTSYSDISGLNLSITPSSASNKILIIADISGASNSGNAGVGFRIKQTISAADTFPYLGASAGSRTQASFGAYVASDDNFTGKFSSSVLLSPSTTSAITYTYQFRSQTTDPVYLNRSVDDGDGANTYRNASSITAMEIAG